MVFLVSFLTPGTARGTPSLPKHQGVVLLSHENPFPCPPPYFQQSQDSSTSAHPNQIAHAQPLRSALLVAPSRYQHSSPVSVHPTPPCYQPAGISVHHHPHRNIPQHILAAVSDSQQRSWPSVVEGRRGQLLPERQANLQQYRLQCQLSRHCSAHCSRTGYRSCSSHLLLLLLASCRLYWLANLTLRLWARPVLWVIQ